MKRREDIKRIYFSFLLGWGCCGQGPDSLLANDAQDLHRIDALAMKMAEAQRQLGSLVATSAGAYELTTNRLFPLAILPFAPLSPLTSKESAFLFIWV